MPTHTTLRVHIALEQAGLRLDQCRPSVLSRSRLKSLIMQGQVTVDGVTVEDPATRIHRGQNIRVTIPEPPQLEPQEIPLKIVYEDDDIIIIDKHPGIVVHPGNGNLDKTLVNALLARDGTSLSSIGRALGRPGIVHRLDKNTSGLLIVAKTDTAHYNLAAQFADHRIKRLYQAVVFGVPQQCSGVVEGNIGRHPVHRQKMTVLQRGGKPALTHYRVVQTFSHTASLIECCLATGRTHQIRVHMSSIGHPLIGDLVYGRSPSVRALPQMVMRVIKLFPRQALHACSIRFSHPRTGNTLCFVSQLPFDLKELTNFLELYSMQYT